MEDIDRRIEGLLASIKELRESQADTDRQFKDSMASLRESQADTDRQIKDSMASLRESQADTDRLLKNSIAAHDKLFKEVQKEIGGISNSNGEFAEEYFIMTNG